MANTKYNPANAGRSDFDRLFSAADDTAELVSEVHTARGAFSSLDDRLDDSDEKILEIQTDILTNIKPDITGLEEDVETNAAAITELGDTDSLHTASLYRLIDSSAKNRFLITAESSSATYGNFTVTFDPVFGIVDFEATAANETDTTIYLDRDDCAQDYSGCVLSGCPAGGSASTYELRTATDSVSDFGSGVEITSNTPTRIAIIIRAGCNPNGLVFMPMICWKSYWTMSHVHESYCPPQPQMYREINGDIAAEATARQNADAKHLAALQSMLSGGSKNRVKLKNTVTREGGKADLNPDGYSMTFSGNTAVISMILGDVVNPSSGLVFKYAKTGTVGLLLLHDKTTSTNYKVLDTSGSQEITLNPDHEYDIRHYAGSSMTLNGTWSVMICSKAEWDASQDFAPYIPTIYDVYQLLELESGSRSIEPAPENSGEEER